MYPTLSGIWQVKSYPLPLTPYLHEGSFSLKGNKKGQNIYLATCHSIRGRVFHLKYLCFFREFSLRKCQCPKNKRSIIILPEIRVTTNCKTIECLSKQDSRNWDRCPVIQNCRNVLGKEVVSSLHLPKVLHKHCPNFNQLVGKNQDWASYKFICNFLQFTF